MKSIKYLVVLVCMTLGLANVAKAQIYSNEVCYYRNTANDEALVIKFDGVNNRVYRLWFASYSFVFENNKPTDFYEYDEEWDKVFKLWESDKRLVESIYRRERPCWIYEYDGNLPNSVEEAYSGREVYRKLRCTPKNFCAFSRDKQTIIAGSEKRPNAHYWIRVSKEELLPKKVVPGFIEE